MNLWLSAHFLLAAFLSSSALTPEECQHSVAPVSLDDPSMMLGRWNFLATYTDHEMHIAIMQNVDSSWSNITGLSNSHEGQIHSYDKLNGTCFESTASLTVDGIVGSMNYPNMSSTFHILPSCDGCLVFSVNTTITNLDKLLQMMNIHGNVTGDEFSFHSVFLMGKESTVKDSDLEHFKQQASCFGYSGEPDILYHPKNGFCAEGEGIKISF